MRLWFAKLLVQTSSPALKACVVEDVYRYECQITKRFQHLSGHCSEQLVAEQPYEVLLIAASVAAALCCGSAVTASWLWFLSVIFTAFPSMRGSTPLDVAAASVMDNNELALALEEPDLDKVKWSLTYLPVYWAVCMCWRERTEVDRSSFGVFLKYELLRNPCSRYDWLS